MIKRLINFRLFFLCALILAATILLGVYVFSSSISKLCFAVLLVAVFATMFGSYLIYKKRSLKILSIFVLFMILPVSFLYSSQRKSENLAPFENVPVTVLGRISDFKDANNSYVRLTLDDVKILSGGETISIGENLFLYISAYGFNTSQVKLGRRVIAETKLSIFSVQNMNSYTGGYLAKNIYGQGWCYYYDIEFTEFMDANVRDIVKTKFKENLDNNPFAHSDIGYAMFFGDSDDLDGTVIYSFRNSGVAHVLAVSGLHVSIFLLIINFILKKLKVSDLARLIICGVFLSFYVYLCNFAVSVTRAALMSILMLYAKFRGKSYDRLNSLSFVACLFLSFNPLNLFNISFILSFTTVFAIIVLGSSIYKGLSKYFSKPIASTLSLNLAVQLIIIADDMVFFKNYQLLSLFTNLVAVPLISFAFIYFIFLSLFMMILPFFKILSFVYSATMEFVVRFTATVSAMPFNASVGGTSGLLVCLMLMFMFACSHYLFLNRKKKVPVTLLVGMLMVVTLIFIR